MAVAQRSKEDKRILWQRTAPARAAIEAWTELPKWKPEYAKALEKAKKESEERAKNWADAHKRPQKKTK